MGSILAPENGFEIYQGSAKTLELLVTDVDTGKALDLTDCDVYFTARRLIEDPIPVIFKSSLDPLQIAKTRPTYGIAQIYLGPTDTRSLEIGEYVFDVWVRLPSGKPYPVIEPSRLVVKWAVTRL